MSDGPVHPRPPQRVAKKAALPKKDVPVPPKEAPKQNAPNAPPTGNLPFVPVAQMPVSADAVLNNLIAKELTHGGGGAIPDDPNITLLKTVVTGLKDADIEQVKIVKLELERGASNQVERAQLVETVLNNINLDRMVRWTLIEYVAEKVIERAVVRGELTTSDAIVLWEKAQSVRKQCRDQMDKTKPVEAAAVINKIDIHTQRQESPSAEIWAGTTPQGREIIRKKLHMLHKRIADVEDKPLEPPKPATRK